MTSRKRTDNALPLIESLFNSMPFSYVFWKNTEGVYMGGSSKQLMMFDKKGTGFIGKTIFEILEDKKAAQAIDDIDNKVMSEGIPITLEESVFTPAGEKKVFLSQKEPIKDAKGEIIGLIGFSIDITERKELEEALLAAKKASEAANEAKTEFLENMRHDIRTPLTGIVGFADLLKMESDNPLVKEYSENLVASSHALLDLLDEVLEAIRVSSGDIPKLKKKFSLEKTLTHIIELNRSRAAQKKLLLTLDYDAAIPRCVIGDKVRVHRIALELVANALNFTDSGHVKLSASLSKQSEGKLIIKIIVEDSGIGIPKDKQQEIYIQFRRLTPSYEGIYKGAGLGLSVVKQFIDELQGEIYVESKPQEGSRFTCVIPLQEPLLDESLGVEDDFEQAIDAPYETTYAQEIKPAVINNSQQRFSVLVVEDNSIAQTVAKSILNQLHCHADIAETGKKAVDIWKKEKYDLIFMDIGLPDIDGYAVTHQIRIQELAKKTHTPIIALTAHAGDENKKRCIEAGMNAVLTKPLTVKNCTDILEAFIPGYGSLHKIQQNAYSSDLPETEESLFDLSQFPILDKEDGIKTMGTEEILVEMLTSLLTELLPEDLMLMKQAYAAKDWDKTQKLCS